VHRSYRSARPNCFFQDERLFLVLAGDSVSSILASRETRVDREMDTEDFASAAERDESRSRLYVVEGEEDGLKSICFPEQMRRINTIDRRWVFCWWTSCRAISPGHSRGVWEPTCYLWCYKIRVSQRKRA